MAGQGVSGVAVACVAAGSVLIWTGLKGGSVALTLQEIIQGQRPSGLAYHPINLPPEAVAGGQAAAGGASAGAQSGGGKISSFPKLPSSGGGGGGGLLPNLPKVQAPKVAPPALTGPVIPPTHITAPKPKPSKPWWHFW